MYKKCIFSIFPTPTCVFLNTHVSDYNRGFHTWKSNGSHPGTFSFFFSSMALRETYIGEAFFGFLLASQATKSSICLCKFKSHDFRLQKKIESNKWRLEKCGLFKMAWNTFWSGLSTSTFQQPSNSCLLFWFQ